MEVAYHTHHKRGDPLARPTMRVEYRVGFNRWVREWVCLEHEGYARRKAEQWWKERSNEPVPNSVEDAVAMGNAGSIAPTQRVTVEKKPGDDWERVVAYELGDKPPRLETTDNMPEPVIAYDGYGFDPDEVPF